MNWMDPMDPMDSRNGAKAQRRMRREGVPLFDFNVAFFAALRLCAIK